MYALSWGDTIASAPDIAAAGHLARPRQTLGASTADQFVGLTGSAGTVCSRDAALPCGGLKRAGVARSPSSSTNLTSAQTRPPRKVLPRVVALLSVGGALAARPGHLVAETPRYVRLLRTRSSGAHSSAPDDRVEGGEHNRASRRRGRASAQAATPRQRRAVRQRAAGLQWWCESVHSWGWLSIMANGPHAFSSIHTWSIGGVSRSVPTAHTSATVNPTN